MELTAEQIAELERLCQRLQTIQWTDTDTDALFGVGGSPDIREFCAVAIETVPEVLADNKRLAARVGELEAESKRLDALMDSVTEVIGAQEGYQQTQIIGRIQTIAERPKWEGVRQQALDRLRVIATDIYRERKTAEVSEHG